MDYNYEKYIWQIQFRPEHMMSTDNHCITIDYLNKNIIDSITDVRYKKTSQTVYKINSAIFNELLQYSLIEDIHQFEKLPDSRFSPYYKGYRDGWKLNYSYFTKENLSRVDGFLSWYYENNPLEKIVLWIQENFPQIHVF